MSTRPPTPPHRPTFNVRLNEERLRRIVRLVFPDHSVTSVQQLESGKSYNNRIYFIDIEPAQVDPGHANAPQSLVLKLAGHFFDHRKIENELGCMLLLRKYCPDLPVPEPFAWSANGTSIRTVDGKKINAQEGKPFSDHAWILTSRLEGRVLTVADLDSKNGDNVLKQLAKYLTMWRTQVPESPLWGNLRIQTDEKSQVDATTFKDLIPGKIFAVDAFLLNNFYWSNTLSYYPTLAQDQLKRLNQEPQFKRTKLAHGAEWEEWIQNDLPQYHLSRERNNVLTHFDFSPRNILMSYIGTQLRVTGILDFEFTGFCPPEEEFLNATIRQEGDWEERHWDVIMREMAKLEQKVPPTPALERSKCFDETEWKRARIIAKTIDRLAPWEIMEGKFGEEELKRELDEAAGAVNEGLKKLRQLNKVKGLGKEM